MNTKCYIERPKFLSVFTYSYDAGNERLTTTAGTGAGIGETVTNGTETVTVIDGGTRVLSTISRDIASNIAISGAEYGRDAFGRPTAVSNTVDGTYTTNEYACCGIARTVDADGVETENAYTRLKQLFASIRLGVTTYNFYDARGNVRQTRISAAGQSDIVTASVYDKAGRLIAATNELGRTTTWSYGTNVAGGKVVTTTFPDSSTRIETYYRDGQLESVSGAAVLPAYYDYGADAEGQYTIEYKGADTNAAEWVKTHTDMLGRATKVIYPDAYQITYTYDSMGRQIKQIDGFTTTLTEYNSNGEAFRSAVDMNGNDTIDLAGSDRISETESSYTTFNGAPARETVSRVYPTNGSAVSLVLSTSFSSLDGTKAWAISFGRTNHTSISRDRATASRAETVTRPDGTRTISIYTNNLLKSVTHYSSATSALSAVNYSHDPFNRLQTTTELAANGNTRMTTMQYNPDGVVTSVTVSAGSLSQTTRHEFDSMGRVVKTTLPDGGIVSRQFSAKGEILSETGARTYPVSHTYDSQGRRATMSTYRDGMNGSADVTTWTYDSQRGFLTNKSYADGNGVFYSYTPDGKLASRIWARTPNTQHLTTLYSYDPAGSLTNIAYSDSTPDVGYTLDRLGRQVTVSQSGTGVSPVVSHTFTYNVDGQLASESITNAPLLGGVGGGYTIARSYDSLGRLANSLLSDPISNFQFPISYSFDSAGRLSSVSDGMNTATYTYGPDGATWTNLSFGAALNTHRTFDGLNRLIGISSVSSVSSVVNSFSYSYNQADQRVTNTLADGSYWVYKYDNMGQVISGKKFFSDGVHVGGAQYEYSFDTIGNRKEVRHRKGIGTKAQSYTANELNQYVQRTVPGEVFITGEAATNATVRVRLDANSPTKPANRHGNYYWQALDADNTATLVATTNLQVRTFMTVVQGTNTNSVLRAETRTAILPQTPEQFTHDADGNLTSDGLWTYTWNAENRLIAMESRSGAPAAFKKRLTFQYDHQGRRVRKTVESGYSGGSYSTTNVTTFVYDGWNIIAETINNQTSTITNSYVWGLDLSGSLQGAGGIGGLLFVLPSTGGAGGGSFFPLSDANGNITDYISTNGAVVAHREYDPFAGTIALTGSKKDDFTHWFSTKYWDTETGKGYWGHRFYDPVTGRWLSRDPIGESDINGNFNLLYAYVRNDAVNLLDFLGLACCKIDLYVSPPKSTAVTKNVLNVVLGTGHTWLVLTEADGTETKWSFGPGAPVGAANVDDFLNGKLPGNVDWPTAGDVVGASKEWDLDQKQCDAAKKTITDKKAAVPNYSPTYQCTSSALDILNSIPVDPPPPSGVGHVIARVYFLGIFYKTLWEGDVANPYHLAVQMGGSSSGGSTSGKKGYTP